MRSGLHPEPRLEGVDGVPGEDERLAPEDVVDVEAVEEGLGVGVVMGSQIDGQIGTACAVAFGAAHRHSARRAGELSNFLDMTDDLLTEPLVITGGELAVRPQPGIGLEVDPEKLARYRLDR